MTEVASWYSAMVLLPWVQTRSPYPRRLLCTPSYVLMSPWKWCMHPLNLRQPRSFERQGCYLSIHSFLEWLNISLNDAKGAYPAIRDTYQKHKNFSKADIDEGTWSLLGRSMKESIWEDDEWANIDSTKWSATLSAWTTGKVPTAQLCAGAGLMQRQAMLNKINLLSRFRSQLKLFSDGYLHTPGLDPPLLSDVNCNPFQTVRTEASDSTRRGVSKKLKMVHDFLQGVVGTLYTKDSRDEIERVGTSKI